jgi:hypothetical protein
MPGSAILQIAATSLQLLGGLVGGYGALHAWNRVSGQLDRVRNSVVSDLQAAAREYVPQEKPQAAPELGGHGQLEGDIAVKMLSDVEERLKLVETQLARLPGRIAKDIDDAIASALKKHTTHEKVFGIKDKWVALLGLAIGLIGTVLRLVDQLSQI